MEDGEEDAEEDEEEDADEEDHTDKDADEDHTINRKSGVKSRAPPMPLPFSAPRVGIPTTGKVKVASKVKHAKKSKSKNQPSAATKGRPLPKPAFKKSVAAQPAIQKEKKGRASRYPSQPPDLGPQFEQPATRNAGKRKIVDAGLDTVEEPPRKKAAKGAKRVS
jgi:hypothetical protein